MNASDSIRVMMRAEIRPSPADMVSAAALAEETLRDRGDVARRAIVVHEIPAPAERRIGF